MDIWIPTYPNTATFAVATSERLPRHSLAYGTGEAADSNGRYHGTRALLMASHAVESIAERWASRSGGGDFRSLFIPESAKRTHRSHLTTVVRQGLKASTGDMLAILRRGRELTDGSTVRFLSAAKLEIDDGGKTLAYECRRDMFADAWDHQYARDLILEARTHFVAPDVSSAFSAHDASETAKLRHAACDRLIEFVQAARTQFESWEPSAD